MKKSILTFAAILALCSTCVFAEYDAEKSGDMSYPTPSCKASYYKKASDPNGEGFWLIQGFDFENYDPDNDPGLTDIVTNEINKITSDEATKAGLNKNYVVVGHSQGGPRALAYATMLKKQKPEEFSKLSAVITVSGVDRGIKALEGGFGPLKTKLSDDVSIVVRGIGGAVTAFDVSGLKSLLLDQFTGGGFINLLLNATGKSTVDAVVSALAFLFDDLNFNFNYILRGWNNESYNRIEQLYDMMPRSDFITNKVCETTTSYKRVPNGTEKQYYWTYKKVGFLKIYYLTSKNVPVYKTVAVTKNTAKFDSDLPVGYIVGTDSDTFGLLNDFDSNGNLDTTRQKVVHGVCTGAGVAFALADAANVVESVICFATINIVGGANHVSAAVNCGKASSYFFNIDSELNDIKGSSENDGLVAVESQYVPLEAHSKILGLNTTDGYVKIDKNHKFSEPAFYGSAADKEAPTDAVDTKAYDIVQEMIYQARNLE